jgi:hypothetical protein
MIVKAEVDAIMLDNKGDIVLLLTPDSVDDAKTFDLPNQNTSNRSDKQLYIPIERNNALLEMLPGDEVEIIVTPIRKKEIKKK